MELLLVDWGPQGEKIRTHVKVTKETLLNDMKDDGSVVFLPYERYSDSDSLVSLCFKNIHSLKKPTSIIVMLKSGDDRRRNYHYEFPDQSSSDQRVIMAEEIQTWLKELKEEHSS